MDAGWQRPGLSVTLGALHAALGRAGPLWVKESSARNLRHRDFLAPRAALGAAFGGEQVPPGVVAAVSALCGPGVLPVSECRHTAAGLEVQLRRGETFRRLLGPTAAPAAPPGPRPAVVLHCAALRCPGPVSPRGLRPVLLADHLAQLLRKQGVSVLLVPAIADKQGREVLRQLRVEWPYSSTAGSDTVSALKQALKQCPYATRCEKGSGEASLPENVICKVHLKSFVEQQGLQGYDPNLGVLLVTEEKLRSLAELQQAVLQGTVSDPLVLPAGSSCTVVHVVSCEEEFQQQQMDLLWRILDPGTHKHLVCGPVKVRAGEVPIHQLQQSPLTAVGFSFQGLWRWQAHRYHTVCSTPTCVLSADEAWTEVIDILTVAAIRFEMLSTAHRSQVGHSISTKGTKSGAFVMYNCARLATLFDTYQRAVEQGEHSSMPLALGDGCFWPSLTGIILSQGEWLLLFSYLLPFPEVLQQAAQLPSPSRGFRITANTEAVCKFLIQLSMDFSSYYNRVHILGEPFPHLFDQMFARLQLLGAVRDMFHSALATLHLPPLSQI
uniref:DALR anticodon binding domain containing 3 n=1 Tax=Coturnix japonica TaxID=93934 RepID=A0A8C2U2B7_COTJA